MSYRPHQYAANGPQGITPPEPYKEPPSQPPKQRPLSRYPGDTEMSWGPGLVAPCYNGKPPSQGGLYMPKCPPVDESGKQLPIPPRQARGFPGERKAR